MMLLEWRIWNPNPNHLNRNRHMRGPHARGRGQNDRAEQRQEVQVLQMQAVEEVLVFFVLDKYLSTGPGCGGEEC